MNTTIRMHEEAPVLKVNINELTYDDLYSIRSTSALLEYQHKAAYESFRKQLEDELLSALLSGRGYTEPLITAVVDGQRIVLDGGIRLSVAKKHAVDSGEAIQLDVICLGILTRVKAFEIAQKMNSQHGVRINAEQQRHIHFRLYILENRPIGSVRELARDFGVTSTATGAKVRKCLKWIESYQDEIQRFVGLGDIEGALGFIKKTLERELPFFNAGSFDALGIPSAGRWAKAIDLMEGADLPIDDGLKERQKALTCLERLLCQHDAESMRWALNKIDKKAVGIKVSRNYDAEAYSLKYTYGGSDF